MGLVLKLQTKTTTTANHFSQLPSDHFSNQKSIAIEV